MACTTPNCGSTTPAGSGLFVTNTPQRTCSGQTFCDDRLEGLPFAGQMDLVGVPEGEQCLARINAAAGIWQHDPSRPGGSDFVGPLQSLQFVPGTKAGEDECGQIPVLRDVTGADGLPAVEVVAQDLTLRSYGDIGLLTRCAGSTARHDVMEPEPYDDDNPCEANLSLLGWITQVVIVNGRNTTRKVWKALTKLVLPDSQLTKFTGTDFTDGTLWRRVAAKKRGNCWEFGLDEVDTGAGDCSSVPSVGTAFNYLTACDGGAQKKVEPALGKTLVGDGTNWQLRKSGMTRIPRYFVAQLNSGYTATTNIPGVTDPNGVSSGNANGDFDMNAITGYAANPGTIAWIRCVCFVNSSTPGECLAQVQANGEILCEAWIDSNFQLGYKVEGTYPVVLTAAGKFNYALICTADPVTLQAHSKIEILGWE